MKSSSLRKLKSRLKFLHKFQKMTKSVGIMSSIRYRRAYQKISKIIPITYYLLSVFKEILKRNYGIDKKIEKKFKTSKSNKILIITIASDRGLAGAFDLTIFEKTKNFIEKLENENKEVFLGVIGKKAETYFKKRTKLLFSFSKFEGLFPENFSKELIDYLNFLIEKGEVKEIFFIRPNLSFAGYLVEEIKISPFSSEALEDMVIKILPKIREWQFLALRKKFEDKLEYLLEPSSEKILEVILKNAFYSLIYAIILESQASLELARIITMQRAEKNSNDLINKISIEYNKLRQNKITQEILDTIQK